MKGIIFIALFVFSINGFFAWPSYNPPHILIIDGTPADHDDFKFIVSIQKNGKNVCGGSIISSFAVLTAAHCIFMNPDYRNLKVVAGISDLDTIYGRQIRTISDDIKMHPKFRNSHLYDIALFKVKIRFYFNNFVQPVNLEQRLISYRRNGDVAGWGQTAPDNTDSQSRILLTASVTILSHSQCYDEYGDDVNKGLLCALPYSSHEDACLGDSGGPLMYGSTLAGIISAGKGCGSTIEPSVYTSVYYFLDWINESLESFS